LKTIGFSRQKTLYCRLLAEAIGSGELDLEELRAMKDHQARAALTQLKGIGDWTVDIYLLMALLRPDVWPKGDLALAVAAQRLKKMKTRPTPDELELMAENWRPHRAVAARMLWHFYLSEKEAQNIRTG
jgi:DNA-3-methyladenine glycosylase II